MGNRIKSVARGWGEGSSFMGTMPKAFNRVDEIKMEQLTIQETNYPEGISYVMHWVYVGYRNGARVIEMYAGQDIDVVYYDAEVE